MVDPYRYFRIEAGEILEQLQKGLLELEKGAPTAGVVPSLLRLAHTLKGAARVVKQKGIADLAHAVEDVLVPLRDAGSSIAPGTIASVLAHVDVMREQLLALSAPATEGVPTNKADAALGDEPFWSAKPNVQDLDLLMDGIAELNTQLGNVRRSRREFERAGSIAELLVEQAGSRRSAQVGDSNVAKLRSLAAELQSSLGAADRELITGVEQAGRELGQIRDVAERLRLVPAELMWGSLERTARDSALSLGKRVKFHARGGDVRLDADLLGHIQRALIQAVRNSIAHGIELPAERTAASKSGDGEIAIEVLRRDRDVVFSCRDDGRGLDLEAVRRRAVVQGSAATEVAALDAQGLMRLLLRGGISTARTVTGMSGRGIGLDVVRETAERLGGIATLESVEGRGTTLTLSVPVSLSALLALLVEVGGRVAAVPLSAVRGTSRQVSDQVTHTAEGDTIVLDGKILPYVSLIRLLGASESDGALRGNHSAVLVEAESGPLVLGVDRLLGIESIIARAFPDLTLMSPVVSAASFDSDGDPRMVLSPEGLVQAARRVVSAPRQASPRRAPILVIDDSLTTRMLEQSILESAGYEVDLATSGEEAIEKARQRKYALFLVDVEMPGMDGFTFIERTRKDAALKDIPAILVTSRASAADLQRGIAVGAHAHIEKKEFNQTDLLERIRRLVS
jgi:two-component system chemotaxis sensor kinase CheA